MQYEIDRKLFHTQDQDSYFIINGKKNSEIINFTIENENLKSNPNISSNIYKSSTNGDIPT